MGRLVKLPQPVPASEDDLVERCRRGDRQALDQVFRAHAPYLERVLHRVAGRSLDVEDLLQSTLVAAIQAFPGFRGEAQVRTWLARIAVHTAQDKLRRVARQRQLPLEAAPEPHVNETADSGIDERRRLARLELHLDALGPKKRAAFVLHVFEGLPLDEVAALTGAGLSATKSRVFWARRELLRRVRKDPWLSELAAGRLR
ncbi:MAG: RNA polymerase sigma factor [Polyangiales bacterium]